MRTLTADYLYPISGAPIANGVITVDDAGTIQSISTGTDRPAADAEYHPGILIPGFINTHCHLELSHMRGRVPTGTKLLPFLRAVVSTRGVEQSEIDAAIRAADAEMYAAGVVAVGDISNRIDTAAVKRTSRLRYYTFVELFDFLQDSWAEKTYQDSRPVYDEQPGDAGHAKAMVPHAPYTVSPALFDRINGVNQGQGTVSIHSQETLEEDRLFKNKEGGFLDFYRAFDLSLGDFQPISQSSIHYTLAQLDARCRTLLVHNTTTTADDIVAAHTWGGDRVFWATCPNANLYIENQLPYYQLFLDADAQMTVGTDSLTSNWQLSILEELRTISRYQSYVPLDDLLRWATLNGARALGFADQLGSLDVGKQPGLLLLHNLHGNSPANYRIGEDTAVTRLV